MAIVITHKDDLEQFVADNIVEFNDHPTRFTAKNLINAFPNEFREADPQYTQTDITPYLSKKFKEYAQNNPNELSADMRDIEGNSKAAIEREIKSYANSKVFAWKDVRNYYEDMILNSVKKTYFTNTGFKDLVFNDVLSFHEYSDDDINDTELTYIKKSLGHLLDDSLFLGLTNGFVRNMTSINTGVMVANEGDAAQFIFLARAILAGFMCANVDVRSCRYDAFIDYNGRLLRVQIKGILSDISSTTQPSIALKDRDRGGAGIDPTAARNRGKFISSKDCDIYAAVDKRFGICYLIPTTKIDEWVDAGRESVPLTELSEYKENWNIISEVGEALEEQ